MPKSYVKLHIPNIYDDVPLPQRRPQFGSMPALNQMHMQQQMPQQQTMMEDPIYDVPPGMSMPQPMPPPHAMYNNETYAGQAYNPMQPYNAPNFAAARQHRPMNQGGWNAHEARQRRKHERKRQQINRWDSGVGGEDSMHRPNYDYRNPDIKRILLTKDPSTRSIKADGIGIKVVGGKMMPDGQLGAFVTGVQQTARVETMGQVREGDQILEWNGATLTGRTFEDVQNVIHESTGEIEVVIRSHHQAPSSGKQVTYGGTTMFNGHSEYYPPAQQPHQQNQQRQQQPLHHQQQQQYHSMDHGYESGGNTLGGPHDQYANASYQFEDPYSVPHNRNTLCQPPPPGHVGYSQFGTQSMQRGGPRPSSYRPNQFNAPPIPPHQQPYDGAMDGHASPAFSNTRPGSPYGQDRPAGVASAVTSSITPTGNIEVNVAYDQSSATLFVTVHGARHLNNRTDGTPPNPFVKIYLLPGRRVEHKRRTKYMMETSSPVWQQTVVYKDIMPHDVRRFCVEFTVWDYDKFGQNLFLGQLSLALDDPSLQMGSPMSYRLQPRGSHQIVRMGPGQPQSMPQQWPPQPHTNPYFNYNYNDNMNANYFADQPTAY